MKKINLLFAVHNHQPVGNLERVFRTGWESCYEPFLAVIEKYPQFRLSLHYSGSLLEWLEEKRPEFLGRLRALIARGQVEVLSGGFYEPFLPVYSRKGCGRSNRPPQPVSRREAECPAAGLLADRKSLDAHPAQNGCPLGPEVHDRR